MITKADLNISNKSYTNKDFAAIYPEVLELCKKITERWDPETSNESDPGIVLLKLAAFIADKNNYNLDKNLLESFMPSATQESSMRRLCEMNGYNMSYYNSATTTIYFNYKGDLTKYGEGDSFTLPKYETTVTDNLEESSVVYTLIEDCTISYSNEWIGAKAIEGSINLLTVGDSNIIQLSHLDANNRVYFPESMVSENSIFINDVASGNLWECVDRLNTHVLGEKIYSFGYDSSQGLPYVEFPSDISTLIGKGLYIRYATTSGVNGNITAGGLSSLLTPTSAASNRYPNGSTTSSNVFDDLTTNLTVNNPSAATNGSDPEDIDSAYSNYKKVIGTFDTLVTCRDYANYIYNLEDDSTFKNIVSNIQVADRRTDFNYSNNVTTYETGYGSYVYSNTSDDNVTPYDLCMYPLRSVDSTTTLDNYNLTFTPADMNDVEYNANLTAAKCLSHNIKRPTTQDVYCFKNKYTLNMKLVTYDKLNDYQASLVINNVKQALYDNFNARELEFGEELSYDIIKKVIEGADDRISSVIFPEPTVTTYVMNSDSNETLIDDASATINNLVAKNILNGTISLFDFNEHYALEIGQTQVVRNATALASTYSGITHITTEVRIPFNKETSDYTEGSDYLTSGYTLKANEVLQFITSNLVAETTYGTYVNYRFESPTTSTISANTTYKLGASDVLRIAYTDSDTNVEQNIIYTVNSISVNGVVTVVADGNMFRPSFTLRAADDTDSATSYVKINGLKYLTLGANQTIDKMVVNKTTINSPTLQCYWIMNNTTNTLFKANDAYEDIVLDDGEYFIYKGSTINILGSGTRLSLSSAPAKDWTIGSFPVSYSDVISNGLNAFDANKLWQSKNLSNNELTVEDMIIYSYSEGDTVIVNKKTSGSHPYIGNSKNGVWTTLPLGVKISGSLSDGTAIDLPVHTTTNLSWQARSRLDMNVGPNKAQVIYFNHLITLLEIDPDTSVIKNTYNLYESKHNWYDKNYQSYDFKLEYLTQEAGGTQVDISLSNLNNEGVTAILYDYEQPSYPLASSTANLEHLEDDDSTYKIKCNKFGESYKWGTGRGKDGNIYLDLLPIFKYEEGQVDKDKSKDEYILIYFDNPTENLTVGISVSAVEVGGGGKLSIYNSTTSPASSVALVGGINIIKLPYESGIKQLMISHNSKSTSLTDTLYIHSIKVTNGFSDALNDSRIVMEGNNSVLSTIRSLATSGGKDTFNYLNVPDNSKAMDISDILSPEAFWDYNNIANPFTIAQLDFSKSTIELANNSRQ